MRLGKPGSERHAMTCAESRMIATRDILARLQEDRISTITPEMQAMIDTAAARLDDLIAHTRATIEALPEADHHLFNEDDE